MALLQGINLTENALKAWINAIYEDIDSDKFAIVDFLGALKLYARKNLSFGRLSYGELYDSAKIFRDKRLSAEINKQTQESLRKESAPSSLKTVIAQQNFSELKNDWRKLSGGDKD